MSGERVEFSPSTPSASLPESSGRRIAGLVGSRYTCTSTTELLIGVRSSCYPMVDFFCISYHYCYTLMGSSSIPMTEVLVEDF
jgi:hypothetical protein